MKTKIRTLCVIGFIGLININANASSKNVVNNEVVEGKAEKVVVEVCKTDASALESAEALTANESDLQVEKFATMQIQFNGTVATKYKFSSSEEMQTSSESDLLIGKYATMQVELQKSRSEK